MSVQFSDLSLDSIPALQVAIANQRSNLKPIFGGNTSRSCLRTRKYSVISQANRYSPTMYAAFTEDFIRQSIHSKEERCTLAANRVRVVHG